MSDPIWPVTLPHMSPSGYGVSHSQNILQTEMEQGPPRKKRLSKAFMTNVTCNFLADRAQQDIFDDFYELGANAGADWVSIPIDTVDGIAHHRVRILSVSYAVTGFDYKTISLSLETEERIKA